jgi:hypothetical protein
MSEEEKFCQFKHELLVTEAIRVDSLLLLKLKRFLIVVCDEHWKMEPIKNLSNF